MGISESLARIQERIDAACRRAGRNAADVCVCAVSKFHSRAAVEEAYNAGLRIFGESRVQEAEEKFGTEGNTLGADARAQMQLHFIGRLQRNKAARAAALVDCVQSLDRIELIAALAAPAASRTEPLPVLLEMLTAEDSKTGFPDEDVLCRAAEAVCACSGLRLAGLMTMAPLEGGEKAARSSFRRLVSTQKALSQRFPNSFDVLSMGMSNDFEIAIEEGATLVRIGTALFGERHD